MEENGSRNEQKCGKGNKSLGEKKREWVGPQNNHEFTFPLETEADGQ